ncbi:cardiolipin synthase [Bacteroides helcogenes]|uniref:Cardiolipin synthase n=1 Tax=Bacteroides helcogenes (strain ATCC 35417 / DSM 20613 / JCM 6297 / CCUG 15421 / P 36-108) TaxID=693979 RepID=E6STH3_BACT6|nr:cardiolipin synthase [Bacteroides helcogenes]ADV43247.1 cardiolipin synthetase 2 [Bacteroides helcogenes P 36-108]MDY5238587.1 cardiolipin synthase [Bacteroides helcogenes]
MFDWNYIAGQIATIAFDIVYFGAIIGTIVVIILDNRNPVKTMAWILVLMFLPVVGLIFYFFFGRSHRRERIIGRNSYGRLLKKPMAEYLAQDSCSLPMAYSRLISLFRHTNQAFPFDGNRVEAYTLGVTMLQSLLRELQKARQHIHMEFYIFEDDAIGRLVRDVLMEKARAGVEVRVIYDDVGCWHVPNSFFEEMREAGVEVRSFLKVRFPLFTSKVNYRNHRKIVVIDGRIGFIGGMNLAERYMCGFPWGIWRDTHWLLEGKAVHGLQTAFLLDWYFVDRTLITSARYFPKLEVCGSSLVQIVTSEPVGPWKEIMQGLVMAISGAKKYFYIQTPYFLPTEAVIIAMQTAALSGVDVRLMIPCRADNRLTHLGSCSYLADALGSGVKVYLYKKGFLHSKLMVSDDELSTVGSTNVDFRSFEHNFEVNAFVYDTETALRMREIFLQDQRDCVQVFLKNWVKRPWHQKAAESVVRLMAPLL